MYLEELYQQICNNIKKSIFRGSRTGGFCGYTANK